MRKLIAIAALFLMGGIADACPPLAVQQSYSTAYGVQAYYAPTSLSYVVQAPAYMPAYGYRVYAPTYVAPSPYSTIGFPAQTPVTIINNNNNAGGPVMGTVFTPGVGVPAANINVFQGRRFRFR